MGRAILGVLVGAVVAWLTIMGCEFASASLHPPPPGLDLREPEALAQFIASAPPAAMALVLLGWSLGAFFGGWVAAKISRAHRVGAAVTVGVLIVVGVIANALLIPHPLWMTVLGVLLPIPLALFAARLATPRAVL